MNFKLNLPSVIYRLTNDDRSRDDLVNTAIEMYTDCVFLAMYCQQAHSLKSVSFVRSAIVTAKMTIRQLIRNITLNTIEQSVLAELDELSMSIINDNRSMRIISSIDSIVTLLGRSKLQGSAIAQVIDQIKLILAVANQIDYTAGVLTVPCIRIGSDLIPYAKTGTKHEIQFSLNRVMNFSGSLWYRLYEGLIFNQYATDFNNRLECLCATINIGIIPDAKTGVGITTFPYELYLASPVVKRFVLQNNAQIDNLYSIKNALLNHNAWLKDDKILSGSLEADYSDSVSPGEESTPEVAPNEESADPPEDTADAPADDSLEADPSADAPSDQTDPTLDNSSDLPTDENNPSPDGLDNPDESRPKLLGLDLALPKNENLDSYLYKISVAKMIDNVIEFNHDGLPLETVTILTKWKSMMLFLTDAEETKRLLADLKIKLK